jgi:hypothetical protein
MKIRLVPSMILAALLVLMSVALFDIAYSQPLPPPGAVPNTEGKTPIGMPVVQRGNAGWHVIVYLRDSNGWYTDGGLSCPHGVCESWPAFSQRLYNYHMAPERMKAFADAWQAEIKFNCSAAIREEQTPRGELCRERRVVYCANLPNGAKCLPPDPVKRYVVKTNGTSLTRPVYAFDGTTRGTKEIGRASVGQPCSLHMPTLASGSDLWASFGPDFEPSKVALCGVAPN